MASCKLLDRTLELVRNRPVTLTYEELAKRTGLNVYWIRLFARGKIDNPGVVHVCRLYEFLAQAELKV